MVTKGGTVSEVAEGTISNVTITNEQHGWLRELAGRFVVFDGPDGSGKSTQFRRLADACAQAGVTVTEVREPGGTAIGEHVREILLDPAHTEMSLRCEMMLYMASRAQLIEQIVHPALDRGELVLADRFVSSTLAYQGTAGGLPAEDIMRVALSAIGPLDGGNWPHLTLIFDVDPETAAARLNPSLDRMELKGDAYHARVREGYLVQVREYADRYAAIDARADTDSVTTAMLETIRTHPSLGIAAAS